MAFFLFLKLKETYFFKKLNAFIPRKLKSFTQELSSYEKINGIFSKSLFYSFLFGFVGLAAANYVLFWALGAEIPILDFLSVIFLISIISSIPISINNIGVKEWAYITFFGFFGLSSSLVVTAALLSRLLQMLVSLLAIPFYLRNKRLE